MVLVYHPMFVTNLLSAMPTNYNCGYRFYSAQLAKRQQNTLSSRLSEAHGGIFALKVTNCVTKVRRFLDSLRSLEMTALAILLTS